MISSLTKATLAAFSCLGCSSILFAQQDEAAPIAPPVAKEEIAKETQLKAMAGTIFFYNGDSIAGEITEWTKDSVAINSPDLVDPVSFSTAKILNITLQDNRNTALEVDPNEDETTLVINNRDNQLGLHGVIKGGFSNIDDKHVTLSTNYAGEIKVLKKFVTKMEIDSKKGFLYLGPKSLDEWYNNSVDQTWEFTNNSLIGGELAGNLGQDVDLPDEASISFDLSWKNDEYITLYLFSSDHEQSTPDDFYKLGLHRGKISLYKYNNGRRQSHISSEQQQKIGRQFRIQPTRTNLKTRERNARYDIYMSKTKGEFHIYRNGIKLDSFTDSTPLPGKFGKALHIVSGNKTPVRLKNLSISKWSGHIPSDVDADTFAKIKGEGERILLKNGDILLGRIGKVRDGSMQIETLYTPLNIPIVRMRSVDLTGTNGKEEPIMYENDIKCWFKDTGWIILKPISIQGNTLTAYHQALGENKFDLNIFKRIDLHIYDKVANANRKSDSW
ncbi:MAG: hypothetical protein ACSHX6_09670 [Akkermansiaceae bacterium]